MRRIIIGKTYVRGIIIGKNIRRLLSVKTRGLLSVKHMLEDYYR